MVYTRSLPRPDWSLEGEWLWMWFHFFITSLVMTHSCSGAQGLSSNAQSISVLTQPPSLEAFPHQSLWIQVGSNTYPHRTWKFYVPHIPRDPSNTKCCFRTLMIHLQSLIVIRKDWKEGLAALLGEWVIVSFLPIESFFPRIDADLLATKATHRRARIHTHTYTHANFLNVHLDML